MPIAHLPLARSTPNTGHFSDKDNDNIDKITNCDICYSDELDNIVFLPCFHHLCYDCFEKLAHTICPWCRHNFSNELSRDSTSQYQDNQDNQDNQNINLYGNYEYLVEQQIFMIENRIAQRDRQLQRRFRNKQRQLQRKQQRQLLTNEFYDFFTIFNQTIYPLDGEVQKENIPPLTLRKKKINHRTSKQPNSRSSILMFR